MQTFLPYPDFAKSMQCLDTKRLGKQRLEIDTMLKTLLGESSAWANHPATNMWRGYENSLIHLFNVCVLTWVERGYKNSYSYKDYLEYNHIHAPSWFGNEEFHASHRSNLLRKDPIFYGKFGWTEPHDLPYVWPK